MIVRRGLGASPTLVTSISDAITRMENVNPTYHNPGGLIAAPGCTSRTGQIAICPDDVTGRAGLERQVGIDVDRGWTLNELINSWAPACADPICKGNNPSAYAQNVSSWTGLPTDVPLASYGDSGASGSWDTSGIDTLDALNTLDMSSPLVWASAALFAILLYMAVE